ncbi:extracellular solute-binding protein [Xylanibacillus composti]|nr:extracellular solute-binding protein [Xylanibacillus composti]
MVLAVFAVWLAGCENHSQDSERTEGDNPIHRSADADEPFRFGETPLQFSYYIHYDFWQTPEWGASPNSKWVQDNLNITVNPIRSGGIAEQTLTNMLATNQLPDAIMLDQGLIVERLRKAGLLVPLDPYLDKYPNLKRLAGEDTLNRLRSGDGKLYQFPNWYTKTPRGNSGWMINTKIYQELGSPPLETYQDLYTYLELVRSQYADVVPLSFGRITTDLDILFAGFGEDMPISYARMKAYPDGDQLKSILENEAWVESMLFASKLFRENLLDQEVLTQTSYQVKEKLNTGKIAVFASINAANEGREAHHAWRSIDPQGGYEMIWPLHKEGVDKNKVFSNDYNTLGWNVNVITTNADNPEGIFAYLDWMTGEEGQRIMFFGPPGLYWDEVDEEGYPIPNETWLNTPRSVIDAQNMEGYVWAVNSTYVDQARVKVLTQHAEQLDDWTTLAQMNIVWPTSRDVTEYLNIDPPLESDIGVITEQVTDYESGIIAQYIKQILFAKNDQEVLRLIEQAKRETEQLGYERVLEYRTQKWQHNLMRLNRQNLTSTD